MDSLQDEALGWPEVIRMGNTDTDMRQPCRSPPPYHADRASVATPLSHRHTRRPNPRIHKHHS